MRRRLTMIPFVGMATVLGACSKQAVEPPHNQGYFVAHPQERVEQIKRCRADQDTENPLNCVAAEDAQRSADLDTDMAH